MRKIEGINKQKNSMVYNKRARKKYIKEHYKLQTVKFKIEEYEDLDNYCKSNNISKNGFMRKCIKEGIIRNYTPD